MQIPSHTSDTTYSLSAASREKEFRILTSIDYLVRLWLLVFGFSNHRCLPSLVFSMPSPDLIKYRSTVGRHMGMGTKVWSICINDKVEVVLACLLQVLLTSWMLSGEVTLFNNSMRCKLQAGFSREKDFSR